VLIIIHKVLSFKVDHMAIKGYNNKMPIVTYNEGWMLYNCFLAVIAVALGFLALKVKGKYLKIFIGFLWFIFLPNTIYIFTDLEHFITQWIYVRPSVHLLLLLQYAVFEFVGIITFLFAVYPFEKIMEAKHMSRKKQVQLLIIFNFLIAFGMVLGRVERINSWEVFTNFPAVFTSAADVFLSFNLIGLTVLFGLLCNFIYFLFRGRTVRLIEKFLH
jgi:uncharacterized membrane protein